MLFFILLSLIWVMFFYYMFFMQGGFCYYMIFEWNILKWRENMKELLKVSVFIFVYNEEVVIWQMLKVMVNFYYLKDCLEIIVVNDNFLDWMGDIVNEFFEKYDFIKMVIIKLFNVGKGKFFVLNFGFVELNGDVICVYDVDNIFEKMVVYYFVFGLMNDEKVGVVVGKFCVINVVKMLLMKFINIEMICF